LGAEPQDSLSDLAAWPDGSVRTRCPELPDVLRFFSSQPSLGGFFTLSGPGLVDLGALLGPCLSSVDPFFEGQSPQDRRRSVFPPSANGHDKVVIFLLQYSNL